MKREQALIAATGSGMSVGVVPSVPVYMPKRW